MNLKRCLSFCLAAVLTVALGISAFADGREPDMSRRGSISVTLRDTGTGKPVKGGKLVCYEVAKLTNKDGSFAFEFTDAFAGSGSSLSNLSSPALAKELTEYAGTQKIPSTDMSADENGTFSAKDLELGLYLIVQTEKAEKYTGINPFIVSVPLDDGVQYIYDVDASPKPGTVTIPTPTPPTTPTVPPTPRPSQPPKLPQTGQLWWPVPVLAICGVACIVIGIARRKYGENE